ncbi:AzlD domain-containing protein [Campylobacter sp. RM19073]|uniref:AzlD domain-containing protein n=1 Tax=Campylobacter porcelli TaxID=1660073 RepID=A0ABU7M418_9BACT|nr:AzlD domain-containing protein [Campylobacter sp. RM19073]MEE3744462.1 AzlD domain-containing protein [Campylobacter sp. CX2-4855-23]MEE3777143.1 AzlD domain-containing protein [Campylobacter sp. CX2-4080-23]
MPYILAGCVATLLCRFLPYFLFKKRSNGEVLKYLERRSTLVIMIILTIYAIASMKFDNIWLGACAVACLFLAITLQIWRKNSLISIAVPTILYIYIANFSGL